MNRIVLVILLMIGFSNCKPNESTVEKTQQIIEQPTQQQVVSQAEAPEKHVKIEERADLSFLLEMNGQYPYTTNLFENEPIKTRLKNIMGGKYQTFLERMEVQTPVRVYDDIVFIGGTMKQNPDKEEAAMVVDVSKNLIWVYTYENGKDLNIFKDDRDVRMPDLLLFKMQQLSK